MYERKIVKVIQICIQSKKKVTNQEKKGFGGWTTLFEPSNSFDIKVY